MHNIVGIDGEKIEDKLVFTITVKDEKIDFLKFEINEKNLEYVNLYKIPIEVLNVLRGKIDDIILREIKVQEILKMEETNND